MSRPKVYPVRFEIKLTEKQHEWLMKKSMSWGLTANQMIRNWIDQDMALTGIHKK